MVVYRVTPDGRRVRRHRRRRRVPRLPGVRRAAATGVTIADPAAARGLLRAALRPGPEHADPRLRPRRGRQHAPAPTSTTAVSRSRSSSSRIELDDKFLDRVVPAILEGTPEVKPDGDTLAKFLVINGELRRKNAEKIASLAKQTSPEMLWGGMVFQPFQQRRRVRVRRPPHLLLQGQGGRPADPPRLRPRLDCRHAGRRRQPRHGPLRRRARHLRQLRDHRPRPGRAVALRATSRRSTSRRATPSRRGSSSAAAA